MAARPPAHLVGSVNLPDARTVFEHAAGEAGGVLGRIPDGETGERSEWIVAQVAVLDRTEGLQRVHRDPTPFDDWLPDEGLVLFGIEEGIEPEQVVVPPLGYAEAARRSFATFRELKRDGTIAPGTRFQVSLPTPLAVVGAYLAIPDKAAMEGVFEAAMRLEVEKILAEIPHDELAIQWDVAAEIHNIDGVFPTFFSPVLGGVAERLGRLASWVPEDVQLGFHLCYGDAGGKHLVEPEDAGTLTDLANAVAREVDRPVEWFHMPVPIERDDDAYFAPLERLDLSAETSVYLGLLHKEDGLEGARRRIAAAKRHLTEFGVSTECGMARDAEPGEVPGLIRQHAEAAQLLEAG